jgi:hypothetical protein
MDTKQIKQHFMFTKGETPNYKLNVFESDFVKYTGFKELISWNADSRDYTRNIYVGTVDGRFFWYVENDNDVWYDGWGFLDEIK